MERSGNAGVPDYIDLFWLSGILMHTHILFNRPPREDSVKFAGMEKTSNISFLSVETRQDDLVYAPL